MPAKSKTKGAFSRLTKIDLGDGVILPAKIVVSAKGNGALFDDHDNGMVYSKEGASITLIDLDSDGVKGLVDGVESMVSKLKGCKIESKKEFSDVLLLILRLINTAKVEQFWSQNNPFASKEDVSSIAVDGPWPDYIEMYFVELESKKRFKLVVETFHGAGGELKEV